jgi:O-antigen/teichoic acid export membrane protein
MAAFLLYLRLDSVMLSVMRNDAEVGWYNAAYRLIEGLVIFPMIIQYVLFPRVSILYLESKGSVEQLVSRSCKHLIAVAFLTAAVGILLADPVMTLVYGRQYAPATASLQILLGGIGFMFLSSLLRDVLNAVNRPLVPLIGGLLGVAVNVVTNLFLIPRYGHIGTSISTVLAELTLFSLMIGALYRRGYRLELMRWVVKPTLALLPSVGVMLLLRDWHFVLVALAGTSVYVSGLLSLRYLEADELQALAAMRKRLYRAAAGR